MRLAFAAFEHACRLEDSLKDLIGQGWRPEQLTLVGRDAAPWPEADSCACGGSGAPSSRRLGGVRAFSDGAKDPGWRASESRLSKALAGPRAALSAPQGGLLRSIMPAASADYFEPLVETGGWLLFVEAPDAEWERFACRSLLAYASSNVHLCDYVDETRT